MGTFAKKSFKETKYTRLKLPRIYFQMFKEKQDLNLREKFHNKNKLQFFSFTFYDDSLTKSFRGWSAITSTTALKVVAIKLKEKFNSIIKQPSLHIR